MNKARSILLSVAMLGIAALGIFWLTQRNASQNSAHANAENKSDSIAESAVVKSGNKLEPHAKAFSLETSSLRDTQVDGGVLLDANGQAVIDLGMRRLFDYYLSLIGERDLIQIRSLLNDHLLSKYSSANTKMVLQYFDRYTDYLNALTALNIAGLSNPQDRLDNVTALRKKMLGDVMTLVFFAEEEALAVLTLKRMAIANDQSLSANEKARFLAELDNSANYSARTEADTAALVSEQSRQLDVLKLTDVQRTVEREALWGKEAAERLSQLDQQRAQWGARVDQYLQARTRIDANRGLSDRAREQAIAALRAQQFNATEQRRIASLEAIGQLKPGG